MLVIEDLSASYAGAPALFDVSLSVGEGEVATLMGRNGMGKTTTIRAMMGMMPGVGGAVTGGRVQFKGADLTGAASYRVAKAGIGLVPEGRQVFPTLSVEENLIATARDGGRWSLGEVYTFFPRLQERKTQAAAQLSGGEQQMLAIGRALMTNPTLLVLDEATEGLAPLIRAEIWERLAELKRAGQSILVVDKDVTALRSLADRHVILEKGHVVWRGDAKDLEADPDVVDRYLHL
ncbi:MAG: ABC transporter ATP-binding protein [Pseudomonadota bacterium]